MIDHVHSLFSEAFFRRIDDFCFFEEIFLLFEFMFEESRVCEEQVSFAQRGFVWTVGYFSLTAVQR